MIRPLLALVAMASAAAVPAGAQAPPVPPPVEQLTADCRAPVFATDSLVCGDPALRALDSELAEALAGFREPVSTWFEPHAEWFKRRSRCAFAEDHAACAAAAYRERLAVVRAPEPDARPSAARCNDRMVTAVAASGDRVVLLGADGRPLGAALADKARGSWQPFLTLASSAPRLKLAAQSGQKLACRVARADS